MPIHGLGWQRVWTDKLRKWELLGKPLKRAYRAEDFAEHPDLEWFRNAVVDVESAMQLTDMVVGVNRIVLYKQLEARVLPDDKGFGLVWGAISNVIGPARNSKAVGGAVTLGRTPTLHMTEAGLAVPRIVFEEVAHSLVRPTPSNKTDLHPAEYERHVQDMLVRGPENRLIRWWIECHMDIYRGFLNGSDAMAHSTSEQIKEVRNRIAILERHKCRRESPHPNPCPC